MDQRIDTQERLAAAFDAAASHNGSSWALAEKIRALPPELAAISLYARMLAFPGCHFDKLKSLLSCMPDSALANPLPVEMLLGALFLSQKNIGFEEARSRFAQDAHLFEGAPSLAKKALHTLARSETLEAFCQKLDSSEFPFFLCAIERLETSWAAANPQNIAKTRRPGL